MKVVIWDDLAEVVIPTGASAELFPVTERRHDGITTLEHAIDLRIHAWPNSGSSEVLEKMKNLAAMKVIDRVFVIGCPLSKNEIMSLSTTRDDRDYEHV